MSFADLGLSKEILLALSEKGYTEPSPIQAQAIPAVLSGKDLMAAAQTGTGKTAGFTLPILQLLSDPNNHNKAKSNHTRVLILTPTRELAAQIQENVEQYSQHLSLKSTVVFGGVKINPQMAKLRAGVDILVATPGRLLDLYEQNAIKFAQLEMLVLDEADRMLDMGFIRDIKKIIAALPQRRQNLLFSATFSPEIRLLAKGLVNDPVEISVTPENSTASTIEHWLVAVDKNKKSTLLSHLIKDEKWQQVLVFCRTKHGANKLTKILESDGFKASAIHGNKSQGARTKALAGFKDKSIQILVATDIAARGIDISKLPHVVNFDLPNVQEDYVHRIGRTGRAGADGQAVSLVSADEYEQLVDIEHVIQQHIERKEVEGFKAYNVLPASREIRPLKKKQPKKIKGLNDNVKPKVEHKDGQRPGQSRHKVKQGNKPQQSRNKPNANSTKSSDPYNRTR
ncbi:MAG: DEAD/DEAH box helicase [Thalassotalea sp.]